MKPLFIATLSFLMLILVLSALALHVEAFVANGYRFSDAQTAFPAVLFPISVHHGGGISIPLILAAALAGGLNPLLIRYLFVARWHWITEEEYQRLFKSKRKSGI